MIETIEPTWDANETWLIMVGVTLFGAFSVAYGVLLPALYLPLIIMLGALGCRGVSFEFRGQPREPGSTCGIARFVGLGSRHSLSGHHRRVGASTGSIRVENGRFVGSALDVLRPYPIFMGVVLLSGYLTLGASWIVSAPQGLCVTLRYGSYACSSDLAVLAVFAVGFSTAVQPGIGAGWGSAGHCYCFSFWHS